jgi:hypothetical protein
MKLELLRIEDTPDVCLGILRHEGKFVCCTLELPWRDNEPNFSRIPTETYVCRRYSSPRFGETFVVLVGQGRTHILFHTGNTVDDIRGCILVGEAFGWMGNNLRGVINSRGIFDRRFMKLLEGVDEFTLVIRSV